VDVTILSSPALPVSTNRYSNASTLKFDLAYSLASQFNNYGFIMWVFISVFVTVYALIVAIHGAVILMH
jgi:hypothetical protein